MEEKKYITINNKNIVLRVILFIIALAVAIGAFTYGCSSMNKKEPGFYSLDASEGNINYYTKNINFNYYLSGKSNAITSKYNTLNALYKDSLKKIYQELDSSYQEDYIYTGIGYINTHKNEDITVSDELYDILKDAYTKTLEKKNYNMFAGLVYGYWDNLFMSSNHIQFDPLNDETNRDKLAILISLTNNLSNFSLVFKDNYVVNFSISQALQDYLAENIEISDPILDLNILSEAYIVDYVANEFKKNNYIEGYIYTNSGICVNLYDNNEMYYVQSDYSNDNIVTFGNIIMNNKISYSKFSYYQDYEDDEFDRYYIVNNVRRNRYIALSTGYSNSLLNRFTIYGDDVIESTYLNNQVCAIETKEELDAFISNIDSNYHYAYTLNDDDKIIYLDDYLKQYFKLNENSSYTIK